MTSSRTAARRRPDRPREDHGLFGPGSISWKVWGHPTSLTIGFQRAVVIEELDPFLLAAVATTDKVRYAPKARYDGTIAYFATIAFADTRSCVEMSEMLYRIHDRAQGIEPISGLPYAANDPDTQLWILITGWQSVLKAYETFGPGRLTEEEDREYWAQCAIAAEFQTCDPAAVPRSSAEVRQYYADVRSRLCVTEDTRAIMGHLLEAKALATDGSPWYERPVLAVVGRFIRMATISTMPRWMRELSGFRQSRVTDALITPIVKIAIRVTSPTPARLALLDRISPAVRSIVEPAFTGVEPLDPRVVDAAEARESYAKHPSPREQALAALRPLEVAAR